MLEIKEINIKEMGVENEERKREKKAVIK